MNAPAELMKLAERIEGYTSKYRGDWSCATPSLRWDELDSIVAALRQAGAPRSEVRTSEPVAWQYREKMPNGAWGIWRHCDIVREDPNLDYRPLFLGAAQAQIDPGVLSRLRRWRDVGDGPISYCAGGSDFAADVTKLVGAFDTTAVPSAEGK